VYAVLENDARRLLAYHIISQVGYMVAGVGIGTELAINGVCAHAFAHILYKGLLFMGVGSVLYMTGKSRFTDLGGLYSRMPRAFVFTLIGGLSISAFPLFSGFVSKSMIVAAGFDDHLYWAAFLLTLASAGTFLHTGLKVPYFIWFGKNNCTRDTWEKAEDPPMHMQLAMGIAAFLCIFIGVYTPYLYDMLPYAVAYDPYTAYHVTESMQILLFTALGFFVFLKKLTPEPVISLDLDWFYRMGGRVFLLGSQKGMDYLSVRAHKYLGDAIPRRLNVFSQSAPARLSLLLIRPLWYLTGVTVKGPDGVEKRFTETFNRSLFTIGSSAVFILIVLMVLLFFIT
jgi:multicomponent Na+:H+ antiporter subunit D